MGEPAPRVSPYTGHPRPETPQVAERTVGNMTLDEIVQELRNKELMMNVALGEDVPTRRTYPPSKGKGVRQRLEM